MKELTQALKKLHLQKNAWLCSELITGLKAVGVKVELEETKYDLYGPMKTLLRIENENGRRHIVGLTQKVVIK